MSKEQRKGSSLHSRPCSIWHILRYLKKSLEMILLLVEISLKDLKVFLEYNCEIKWIPVSVYRVRSKSGVITDKESKGIIKGLVKVEIWVSESEVRKDAFTVSRQCLESVCLNVMAPNTPCTLKRHKCCSICNQHFSLEGDHQCYNWSKITALWYSL